MSRDLVPACDDAVRSREYRQATESDIECRRPCKYCFGDSYDIDDIDQAELIVATGQNSVVIHRHIDTGKVDIQDYRTGTTISNLAKQLEREDVTDPSDIDFQHTSGGEQA